MRNRIVDPESVGRGPGAGGAAVIPHFPLILDSKKTTSCVETRSELHGQDCAVEDLKERFQGL